MTRTSGSAAAGCQAMIRSGRTAATRSASGCVPSPMTGARGRRIVAATDRGGDTVAGASRVDQLGGMRRQRHRPARGLGQHDCAATVVLDPDRRSLRLCRSREHRHAKPEGRQQATHYLPIAPNASHEADATPGMLRSRLCRSAGMPLRGSAQRFGVGFHSSSATSAKRRSCGQALGTGCSAPWSPGTGSPCWRRARRSWRTCDPECCSRPPRLRCCG